MKILHVDSARSWRGGQNQVLLTAQAMARLGHEVSVVCQAGGALESRSRDLGLDVRTAHFGGDLSARAVLALAGLLRRTRPEIVQLHDPHATAVGLLAARLGGAAHLVATRRVDFQLRGWLSRWKYRTPHRVIAISEAIARVLEACGVPRGRVRLVYEGVMDRAPQAGGAEALEGLGVPAGVPVVGNVAALTDHKDHATLLRAAAQVLRRLPTTRFVVVGDGELRESLEHLVRELGIGGNVVFTGFRRDLDRLLPAFTVFCLSSHLEGLGTSLLDAMCFSRAVVATAAGGIPEAVQDGETGRVVPVRDPAALASALVDVLGDTARREAMGHAGRQRFERLFTVEHMAHQTLGVYEELLDGLCVTA